MDTLSTPGAGSILQRSGSLPPPLGGWARGGRRYTQRGMAGAEAGASAEAQTIQVRVRLFASYREAAGTGDLDVVLPAEARVADLAAALAQRFPRLRVDTGLIAVNHEYVGPELRLRDGDEAAFIPPVSGG